MDIVLYDARLVDFRRQASPSGLISVPAWAKGFR